MPQPYPALPGSPVPLANARMPSHDALTDAAGLTSRSRTLPACTAARPCSADAARRARRAGHVMLNRMDRRSQLKCLGDCRALLQQGASVLFFPEGTRSNGGRLGEWKKARVATKT